MPVEASWKQGTMKTTILQIFTFVLFILPVPGNGWSCLSACNNADAFPPVRHFELNVQVLSDVVEIEVNNLDGQTTLNENLVIEQWNDSDGKWIFAAAPLWFCATKETVFSRPLRENETVVIPWKKTLHRHCQQANAGKFRVLIQEHDGELLSDPVVFYLPGANGGSGNQR